MIETPPPNSALLEIKTQRILLQRRLALLRNYLKKDPTLIHFHAEWQAIAHTVIKLHEKIEALKQHAKPLQKTFLEEQKQALHPNTLLFFEETLHTLEEKLGQAQPIQNELARLHSHPLFTAYRREQPALEQRFIELQKASIDAWCAEITTLSATLFLRIPIDKIVEMKSDPHRNIARYFNQLHHFVTADILEHDDLNARTAAMTHWIPVMCHLLDAGDFCSFYSVTAALTSGAIRALGNTRAGLSTQDQARLTMLGNFSEDYNELLKEILKRPFAIPYLGCFYQKFEKAEVHESSGAQKKIADQIMKLQSSATEKFPLATTTTLKRWGCDSESRKDETDFCAIQRTHHARALQLEPRGNVGLPGNLFSETPHCWLAELQNKTLAELLLNQCLCFKKPMDPARLDTLNAAAHKKLMGAPFQRCLSEVGIDLPEDTLCWLNAANGLCSRITLTAPPENARYQFR